jgi:hypothetical protein
MDEGRTLDAVGVVSAVPTQRRHDDADPVQVTCGGVGPPPFAVLARVTHVFCGDTAVEAWSALRACDVAQGDLVLLRVGQGAAEEWTELRIAAPDDLA